MLPITQNRILLGASLPTLTKKSYMGDYAYFFDIDSRYHGYTRDKQVFHVYDENNNGYTSYDTPAQFLAWLESYTGGNYQTTNYSPTYTENNNVNESGFFQLAPGGSTGKIILGLAGLSLLAFWALKGKR